MYSGLFICKLINNEKIINDHTYQLNVFDTTDFNINVTHAAYDLFGIADKLTKSTIDKRSTLCLLNYSDNVVDKITNLEINTEFDFTLKCDLVFPMNIHEWNTNKHNLLNKIKHMSHLSVVIPGVICCINYEDLIQLIEKTINIKPCYAILPKINELLNNKISAEIEVMCNKIKELPKFTNARIIDSKKK